MRDRALLCLITSSAEVLQETNSFQRREDTGNAWAWVCFVTVTVTLSKTRHTLEFLSLDTTRANNSLLGTEGKGRSCALWTVGGHPLFFSYWMWLSLLFHHQSPAMAGCEEEIT